MLKALEKPVLPLHVAMLVSASHHRHLVTESSLWIPCREFNWQVSSLDQVCISCLPPLPTLEVLYIYWVAGLGLTMESRLARQHRGHIMAGFQVWFLLKILHWFTMWTWRSSTYLRIEPSIVPPARTCWGQSGRSVACPAEDFLGEALVIGIWDLTRKVLSSLLPYDRLQVTL